jgi:DNA-directed RNA polymerase specialized sigma24 family protein
VLGCATGTVKALTHQGVAQLRELLDDAEPVPVKED